MPPKKIKVVDLLNDIEDVPTGPEPAPCDHILQPPTWPSTLNPGERQSLISSAPRPTLLLTTSGHRGKVISYNPHPMPSLPLVKHITIEYDSRSNNNIKYTKWAQCIFDLSITPALYIRLMDPVARPERASHPSFGGVALAPSLEYRWCPTAAVSVHFGTPWVPRFATAQSEPLSHWMESPAPFA